MAWSVEVQLFKVTSTVTVPVVFAVNVGAVDPSCQR